MRAIFMKSLLLITLTVFCLTTDSQTLRQELLRQDSTLKDVTIIKCNVDPNLFITILVREKDWWEDLQVVNFSNGHIQWVASFDTVPSSQSIYTARQISLKGIAFPLIEVFDVTHQGNGYYYLYELKGKHAKLITQTRAVDWNFDGGLEYNHKYCSIIYKNGTLTPTYKDMNNDGYTDIILKGTIQIYDDDWKTMLKQYPAQKVLYYNKSKNKFVEDLKRRKGFKMDDD